MSQANRCSARCARRTWRRWHDGKAGRFPPMKLFSRFVILAGFGFLPAAGLAATDYKLILHRGGIVENKYPDNSAGALDSAAARKVWMLEVDIRETRDGIAVMRHDPDLKLHFNDGRRVQDLTWEELATLRAPLANQRLLTFEDLVARAKRANLRLMLDTKPPHSEKFPALIESILAKHDMVRTCYVIGTPESRRHFLGKALVGANRRVLQELLEKDPAAVKQYFLFEHGNVLMPDMVAWARRHDIKIVPTVNLFHYETRNPDGSVRHDRPAIMAAAQKDIERLKAGGVSEFQIDSEFMAWFGK